MQKNLHKIGDIKIITLEVKYSNPCTPLCFKQGGMESK